MKNKLKKHLVNALFTGFFSLFISAIGIANNNIPQPDQAQTIMLSGATIHTLNGAPIVNGKMVFAGGKITAIGEATQITLPRGAREIALNGKHVYPGFISANTALGLVESQAVRATVDTAELGAINPNMRALVAINADSELLPVARANGILTALAVPQIGRGGLIAGTSAIIELDGWNWQQMGLLGEAGLHIFLPSLRFSATLFPGMPPKRLEDMQKLAEQNLKTLEASFDSAAAYINAKNADASQATDTRWESMRTVINGGRTVFIHADELPQIRYALTFAQRYKLKIVIVGGMDAPLIAPLLKQQEIPVVLAGIHRLPMRRGDAFDAPYRVAAHLHEAGVKFAISRSGTSFDAAHERSLPYEAATAAAYGLPIDEALKAITVYPAQILGVADKIGTLEVGKLATFIITDGNPLEITTNVENAYIRGKALDLTNRQTRLQQKYQEKYRQLGAAVPAK